MSDMPDVTQLLLVLFGAGVVSSGVTQMLKQFFSVLIKKTKDKLDPAWWQGLFRLLPLLIGTAIGYAFFKDAWGLTAGACGGIGSAFIYAKFITTIRSVKIPLPGMKPAEEAKSDDEPVS